jgi:hypothetical protein
VKSPNGPDVAIALERALVQLLDDRHHRVLAAQRHERGLRRLLHALVLVLEQVEDEQAHRVGVPRLRHRLEGGGTQRKPANGAKKKSSGRRAA